MCDHKLNSNDIQKTSFYLGGGIAVFEGWNLLPFFFPPDSVSELSDPPQLSQMKGSYYGHRSQQGSPQCTITLIACALGLFSVPLTQCWVNMLILWEPRGK